MSKQDAISQAIGLNQRWPDLKAKWVVIQRGEIFVPKMLGSSLNGQRVGIDYSETQIVWTPDAKAL